jgi:phospholipid-binding lipoprotein MlaA
MTNTIKRVWMLGALCLAVVLSTGCATNNPRDPLEPFNRNMFKFNEAVDVNVGQPIAKTYNRFVPLLVRTGISNFFNNTYDFVSSVNCVLQLRLQCGGENILRFGVNTFFGLGGLLDIATEAGIPRTNSDFGITLGRYGIGSGPYLVLPFLGPSSFRDVTSTAYGIDGRLNPIKKIEDASTSNGLTALGFVNTRAKLLRASDLFDDVAIDKYTFAREAFIQRRRSQVYDGNPPDEEGSKEDNDDSGYKADAAKAEAQKPPATNPAAVKTDILPNKMPAAEMPVSPASTPK